MKDGKVLRSAGLKVTVPRVKILRLLESSKSNHFTAEDIFKALLANNEEVSITTIYRVLAQFEEAKIVIKHNFDSANAVYELNTDNHHDHMVCLHSGDIIEFYDEVIEQRQKDIANEHGFEIINHSLTLYVKPKKNKK